MFARAPGIMARRLLKHARKSLRRITKWRRRTLKAIRRHIRPLRVRYRKRLERHLTGLERDIGVVKAHRSGASWRRKTVYGTPFRADLRALRTWRGESPRIALRNHFNHPIWRTYRTHPPLRYTPSPLAELDHWVNLLPEQFGARGSAFSERPRASRLAARPHVLEAEHWYVLAGVRPGAWGEALARRQWMEDRIRADECKGVVTLSHGLLEHFRQFLAPDVWPKLDYAFPAFPFQPEAEYSRDGVFTVLAIGNRFSDKGIPEALRAFAVLRERHGPRVRMTLVSARIPRAYRLPEGVEVYDQIRMSSEVKARVYRSADAFLALSYVDSMGNFTEACAFGLPLVSTRLHHGEDFVRDGESGYLIDSPVSAYTAEYGARWKSWPAFLAELERMRESGKLESVVESAVDVLEPMLSGEVDLDGLRRGARRLHAERFSPEARNARLNAIYARALAQ